MVKTFKYLAVALAFVLIDSSFAITGGCMQRMYGGDSFVCVCNSTFCDEPGLITPPNDGMYFQVSSALSMYRMNPFLGTIDDAPGNAQVSVSVNASNSYQTILGFGGAFTDSAGLNMNSLSPETREWLHRSYWAPEGSEYSIGRVNIGGCDYSPRLYTLDDVEGDVELAHWALQPEDFNHKIPNIKQAMQLSEQDVLIFGSPWTPPLWMKSEKADNGTAGLLPQYYQPYADYIVRWVHAYESEGVPVWGLTPQNEPLDHEEDWGDNTCLWHPDEMKEWIKDYLGPSLESAGYDRIKIMADDFNRYTLPYYVEPCFTDPDCSQYVDGVAVHWYADETVPPEVLLETRDLDPTKFILYTEACNGLGVPSAEAVLLGDWARGERYLYNILEDINYYSVGWVDWNLVLNLVGGPSYVGNTLDAAVITNATADEFYKQPTYYALMHVSKFFKRGDLRIDAISSEDSVKAAAVIKEDRSVAVVVLNTGEDDTNISISIDGSRFINTGILAKSFNSFLISP